jgi:Trypsin-like peptidase domain
LDMNAGGTVGFMQRIFDTGPTPNLERMRSFIFSTCANNATALASLDHGRREWPHTPHLTGNIGFLLTANGYALGYQSQDCGCISPETRKHLYVEMYRPDGTAVPIPARVVRSPAKDSSDPLHGRTDACLLKLSSLRLSQHLAPMTPVIRAAPIRPGEALWSFGCLRDTWYLSAGNFISYQGGEACITTDTEIWSTLQVAHGFCGSVLFDHDGRLIGLGARIAGTDEKRSTKHRWRRKYDVGLFQPIAPLVHAFAKDLKARPEIE